MGTALGRYPLSAPFYLSRITVTQSTLPPIGGFILDIFIVAESISRIFFRNCICVGLPIMSCKGINGFCEEGDMLNINYITGDIINQLTNQKIRGEPLPLNSPPMEILNSGGIIEYLKKECSSR